MKPNRIIQLAAAFAGLAAALPAGAASVATGDLILGVRATGGVGSGFTYVVSLGQASQFTSPATATITIGDTGSDIYRGNIGQDLTDVYGAGWASRADLQWAIAGGTSGNNLFASAPQTGTTIPTALQINTLSGRNLAFSDIQNIVGIGIVGGLDDSPATVNSAGSIESTSYQNNWRGYLAPGGTAGQAGATGTVDLYSFGGAGIEGTPDQALALFNLTSGAAGSFVGSFSIAPTGTVTFVPEPSSVLLLGGSLVTLVFSRRRRNA